MLIQNSLTPPINTVIARMNSSGYEVSAVNISPEVSNWSFFDLVDKDQTAGRVRSFGVAESSGRAGQFISYLLPRLAALGDSDAELVHGLLKETRFIVQFDRDESFEESGFWNLQYGLYCQLCRYSQSGETDGIWYIHEGGQVVFADEVDDYLTLDDSFV